MKKYLMRLISVLCIVSILLSLVACDLNTEYDEGEDESTDLEDVKLVHTHVASDWETKREPTCAEDGIESKVCTKCGKVMDSRTIEKTEDHNVVIDKRIPATETADGFTEGSHCSVCDLVFVEPTLIPKLGSVALESITMQMSGTSITGKVSHAVESFDFVKDLSITTNAPWTVSTDPRGSRIVASKRVPLAEGNNRYYIHLTLPDDSARVYTVDIYRNHMYTVSFDSMGGTLAESQQVEEGYLASAPTTSREGYNFASWDYDFSKPVSGNMTVSASWTPRTDIPYTVEFYFENIYDDGYTRDPEMTRHLEGTYLETAYADVPDIEHFTHNPDVSELEGVVVLGEGLTLKVYYTRNKYKVTTDVNNYRAGTVGIGGEYKYGTELTLDAVTNDGYAFVGWHDGENKLSGYESYKFTLSADIDLVARFTVRVDTDYKVEYYFDSLDGTPVHDEKQDEMLKGATESTVDAPLKSFEHFTFDPDRSFASGEVEPDGTLVLRMYYSRNIYTLSTFVSSGLAGSSSGDGSFRYGETFTVTAESMPGYIFLGWYDSNVKVGSDEIYSSTIGKNTDLTAKWRARDDIKYTVVYYLENELGDYIFAESRTEELTGTTDSCVEPPRRDIKHYTFNEEMSDAGGTVFADGSLVLTVYYSVSSYTVTTHPSSELAGSITVTTPDSLKYGAVFEAYATSMPGYDFDGWYDGDSLVTGDLEVSIKPERDTELIAKWTPRSDIPYRVMYYLEDLNGIYGRVEDLTEYLHGTTDSTVRITPKTIPHFTFNPDMSSVEGRVTADGELILVLNYSRNRYEMTLETENGEAGFVSPGGNYYYEEEFVIEAYVNPGYDFVGWYEGNKLVSSVPMYSMSLDRNMTLTAKWRPRDDTDYIIEYYFEGLDGEYYIDGSLTEHLKGTTATIVGVEPQEYDHFTLNLSESITEGKVDAIDTLILCVCYTRNEYTVSVALSDKDAGEATVGGTYKYGTELTLEATTNAGYRFAGWYNGNTRLASGETYTFTVEENIEITARWMARNVGYRIEYYFEDADGNYVLDGSKTLSKTAPTGSLVSADLLIVEHFAKNTEHPESLEQATVKGDGSLVLRVYYKRALYDVMTERSDESAGTVTDSANLRYGTEFTAVAVTNPGYRFLGWYAGSELLSSGETVTVTVDGDITLTAKWEKRTDYKYTVKYCFEKLDDDGSYSEDEDMRQVLEGALGEHVVAEIPDIDHYTVLIAGTVKEGEILEDGSLELVIYYARKTYTVSSSDEGLGTVTGAGSYKYDGKQVELVANPGDNADFLGWYKGETLLSESLEYTGVIDGDIVAVFEALTE